MTDPSLIERKKGMNGCVMAIIASVVALLLAVCLYWIWSTRCHQQFARQVAEIRERGEPTTMDELLSYYQLPDDAVDVTDAWVNAVGGIETDDEFVSSLSSYRFFRSAIAELSAEVPPVGSNWKQRPKLEAYLEQYRRQTNAMHAAAEMQGEVRYDVLVDQAARLRFDFESIRNATRILYLNARLNAHKGDSDEVVQSLIAMTKLGNTMIDFPNIAAQHTRAAAFAISSHAVGQSLQDINLSDTQLEEIQSAFTDVEVKPQFRRALVGHRCISLEIMRAGLNSDELADINLSGSGFSFEMAQYVKQDSEFHLSMLQRSIDAIDKEYEIANTELSAIIDECEREGASSSPRHVVLALTFPFVKEHLTTRVRFETICEMTAAGIAVKRFQLANHRLPTKLDELVPKYLKGVPIDCYDSQPIRYAHTKDGNGFKLYSIGPDGIDNGGRSVDESPPDEGDFVFSVGFSEMIAEEESDSTEEGPEQRE